MRQNDHMQPRQRDLGILICVVGSLFYCYEFILRIIPGILQNELSLAFGQLSASTFGQLSALYYFAYSPMQLPVGMLIDRFGPRRLLSLACLACALGSWMFADFTSLTVAGIGRFLVGFGSSFVFVGVLSLATTWLPQRYFSLFAGLMTTFGMLGLVYGEVEITSVATSMGLSYVMMILVVIGLALTAIIFGIVRDTPEHKTIPQHTLTVFYQQVWRVLISKQVWLIGVVGACVYTSLSVFGELWGKAYLQQAHHLDPIAAAKTISLLFIGWAVGAPLAGFISDYTKRRALPLVVGAVFSLLCIVIILYVPHLSYTSLNLLMFFYGLFSGSEIIVFVMGKENSQATLSGTVFAVINMIVTLGGVVFQPLVGFLLDYANTHHTHFTLFGPRHYTTADYQLALSVLPASLILLLILAFFLRDHPRTQD